MSRTLVLDSSPLGLLTKPVKTAETRAINEWLEALSDANWEVIVPEIVDYEVRRELLRAKKAEGIARLNTLKTKVRYLPITTEAMLRAADLWAQARQKGFVTADSKALDVDVILAAQTLILGLPPTDVIIATINVKHLSWFVAADLWENITPKRS